jgi:general secretion pathway protein C
MNLPEPASEAAKWALVVGLAFFSADATSAFIGKKLQVVPKPLPEASVGVIQDNVPAQAAPQGLVSLLKTTEPEKTEADLAASSAGGDPSVKAAPVQAPSNLKLRGTMAGGGGSGLAMIDVNNQTQVVGTGEEIGGMTVTHVTPYSVTLEANGQIQILEMDSNSQLAGPPRAQPRPVATQPTPDPTPQEDEIGEPEELGEGDAILTQRELRNILDNPAQFAGKGFRMKPVLKGGEIIGMRVALKNSGHPLARLGIQDGDIVKSLNGTPLNGPESLSAIYRVLRNTSSLSFDVDRGGVTQKIDITLEE